MGTTNILAPPFGKSDRCVILLDQQVTWTTISMPKAVCGANTRVCRVETLLDARLAFNISQPNKFLIPQEVWE